MIKLNIILASLLAVSPALALDCKKPILDQSGQPAHERIKDGVTDLTSPILTVGNVVATALLTPKPQPQSGQRGGAPDDPVANAKRAALALKIINEDHVDLTAEQVTDIKGALVIFPPLTALRVLEEIDPASLK